MTLNLTGLTTVHLTAVLFLHFFFHSFVVRLPPPPLQIKPLALRPVKVSEDETVQELSRPHRSNSKEQLSEVSRAPRKATS